jgi:hypothetical protein
MKKEEKLKELVYDMEGLCKCIVVNINNLYSIPMKFSLKQLMKLETLMWTRRLKVFANKLESLLEVKHGTRKK